MAHRHRLSLFISVSVMFLAGVFCVSAELEVSDAAVRAYQTGVQALARGDTAAAFAAFQRAVVLDPEFAEAHYRIGVLYGKHSQWKPAIAALQTSVKLNPDSVAAHVRLGEAHLIGTGRAEAANAPLEHALRLQPDAPRARRLLGHAYLRQNRIAAAIQQLQQLQQDPEARYLLGLAYFQSEDYGAAIPHFQAVLERQPRHVKAHFNLGNCYLRTGKIAEGRRALRTFEKLTREAEQIAALHRVIHNAPAQLGPRYELAELYIKRKEWELAIQELTTCRTIAPDAEKAAELLGYIYLQTAAYPEALAVYGELVERHPNRARYRNSLGIVYMMLKKHRQAIAQFEASTQLETTNPQLYRNLANAYREKGDPVKAEQAARRYRALMER